MQISCQKKKNRKKICKKQTKQQDMQLLNNQQRARSFANQVFSDTMRQAFCQNLSLFGKVDPYTGRLW